MGLRWLAFFRRKKDQKTKRWEHPKCLPFATLASLCDYWKTTAESTSQTTELPISEIEAEGVKCALCLDTEGPEKAVRLPCCGQLIGDLCVRTWFSTRSRPHGWMRNLSTSKGMCPYCRFQLLDQYYLDSLDLPLVREDEVDDGIFFEEYDEDESHSSIESYGGTVEEESDSNSERHAATEFSWSGTLPDESAWMRFVRELPTEMRNWLYLTY